MDLVWGHEREMLGEVGLDFRGVVGRGLEVKSAINGTGTGSKSSISNVASRQNGPLIADTPSRTVVDGSLNGA